MKRAMLAAALLLVALVPAVDAGRDARDDRLESLYTSFVAPCCWRDNLKIHQSAAAEEVRARIRNLVDAGKSDEEIKAALVRDYGRRILIVPEGSGAGWLFRTPWLLAAAALGIVVVLLRRMRRVEARVTSSETTESGRTI